MPLTMTGTGAQARIPVDPQQAGGRIPTDPVAAGLGAGGQISPNPTTAETQKAGITLTPA